MCRNNAFIWMLIVPAIFASSFTAEGSVREQWDFAQHLFNQGEYYRAITEYMRFIYYFPDEERVDLARLRVTEAYIRGRWWREGLGSAQDALAETLDPEIRAGIYFLQGICYLQLQQGKKAVESFQRVLTLSQNAALREQALYLKGRALLQDDLWKEAVEALEKMSPLGGLGARARRGAESIRSQTPPKDKSSWMAGFLAAVLPGAGHLYLERWRDAALIFAVNGAFTAATLEAIDKENRPLAGMLAFTELMWYSGNIFSAVSSTHKHNQSLRDELAAQLPFSLNETLSPLENNEIK